MEYRLASKSGNKFYKTNILETIQENIYAGNKIRINLKVLLH